MRRAFGFDVLACPRCGHTMRLIALLEETEVIRRILRHLGEPTDVPARAPPLIAAGGEGLGADDTPGLTYDREPPPNYDEPC
jgi:hypothetical protein